ncbi:MAG: sugar-binding protein [Armatimonadota bacterium]
MPRIIWCILACCLLAGYAHAAELPSIPPKSQRIITLTAGKDDAFLAVEGRFVLEHESRPLPMIRLVLNGTLLEGERIIGPHTMYAPLIDTFRYTPRSRYSSVDRCFAFPMDTDYTHGNGPWWSEMNERIAGCPALLQLRVGDLLKPGKNELLIVNGGHKAFELRHCAYASAAVEQQEPLLTKPGWISPALNAEIRKMYQTALKGGKLSPAESAHIHTALGTAEFLREGGDRKAAIRHWQQALATSDNFALRGEAAYRLVAVRTRTGRWPDAHTEALVRAAAVGDESWAGLTRAVLDALEGKQDSAARPLIRPAAVATEITLDGQLDETCWKSAKTYPIANPMGDENGKYFDTQVRYVVTPGGLAVGFTGVLPAQNEWSCGITRDQPVWEDNCVEIFLSPDTDLRHYYEMNATPLGAQYDGRNTWWWKTNGDWNGNWKMASQIHGTDFTVEYLIPWSDLGFKARPARGTLMITGAARFVVELQNEKRVGWFYTMTKHRGYDCHRMMDGAVLVMP